MGAGRKTWSAARAELKQLLGSDSSLKDDAATRAKVLVAQNAVTMLLPAHIGDYSDFYASREHATNVGTMIRGKDNALQPNW
jgi:fumarylacetoacetase